MQDHDVIGAHQLGELSPTPGQASFVDGPGIRPQAAPVSVDSVQMVVQPFGDGKEPRVADDHHPPRVDTAAPGIAE